MSFENKIGEGKYVISVDNQGAISQLQRFDDKVQDSARKTQTSFRQAATSAVSLASGIGSLYFQYDNLEKVQLRIRKAGLEVSRAQEAVNKLVSEGKKDTLDYQQALERLSIAEEKHKILSNDLQQSQFALSLSFAQTALSLPAAINGIKGLTSASAILNVVTSKWVLIALAAIAAYEGIAQAIKITTGHDYTLTTAVGNLTTKITGGNQALIEGTANYKAYGESISDVTLSSDKLDTSLTKTKKTIKETNDLVSMWNKINSEALKKNDKILNANQGQIDTFAELFEMQERIANGQDEIAKKTLALALQQGYRQFNLERTIASRGLGDDAELKTRMVGFSRIISDVFRRAAAGGGGGYSNLHGSGILSQFGGLSQKYTNSRIGGGLNSSVGVNSLGQSFQRGRVSGSMKARKGGKGGAKPGWGTQAVEAPFLKAIQGYELSAQEWKQLGFDINIPDFPLSRMVSGYRSPSNEFMQTSIRQATAIYEGGVAKYNQQIADARAVIESRIMSLASRSGLSRSEVVAMQTTQQGTDDLYGIIDYRERLARASTGSG